MTTTHRVTRREELTCQLKARNDGVPFIERKDPTDCVDELCSEIDQLRESLAAARPTAARECGVGEKAMKAAADFAASIEVLPIHRETRMAIIARAKAAFERNGLGVSEDTARLDWLLGGGMVRNVDGYSSMLHYRIDRAAIDAAMQQGGKTP